MLLLSEKDWKDLAAEYVSRGLFYGVMSVWKLDGSTNGVETTEPMRRKVFDDLNGRDASSRQTLEIKIAEQVVRMAASSHTGYRTVDEWRENLDGDEHLMDVLKECFDYMAVVVEAGVKNSIWDAWNCVQECVREDVNGVLGLDRVTFQHKWAYITIRGQPIGAYETPPGRPATEKTESTYAENVQKQLHRMYLRTGGVNAENIENPDFAVELHGCMTCFFYENTHKNWQSRQLPEDRAVALIKTVVRPMLQKYHRDNKYVQQYSPEVQELFAKLWQLVCGGQAGQAEAPGAPETHRARCDFCDGKGLDHTNCGPLPLEKCTKLAVRAAEKIRKCLDAHAKDNSDDNKKALCAVLCAESNTELRAFMIEYRKPDVHAMLVELAHHLDWDP
jgi:hypothetical protein